MYVFIFGLVMFLGSPSPRFFVVRGGGGGGGGSALHILYMQFIVVGYCAPFFSPLRNLHLSFFFSYVRFSCAIFYCLLHNYIYSSFFFKNTHTLKHQNYN